MRRTHLLPLIAASALVAGTVPATAAQDGPTLSMVAFDLGGGETDYEVALRSLDGGTYGKSFGPAKGKYLRGPSGPKFSTDGKRLLFGGHHKLDRDAQSLWVRTVNGKRTTEIPLELGKHGILRGWDWAPSGKRVVFAATRKGVSEVATVYTVKLDGTGLKRLARGQYPTWAQSGGRISFERPGSVHVVDRDGRNARKVADVQGQYRTDATISPDGETVLYVKGVRATEPGNGKTEWHEVDVDSGTDDVIAVRGGSVSAPSYASPVYTPDGAHLLSARYQRPVDGMDESYRVVLLDPDNGTEELFFQFGENEPYGRFPDMDLQP
jgi:Tol biopolymer transport system component